MKKINKYLMAGAALVAPVLSFAEGETAAFDGPAAIADAATRIGGITTASGALYTAALLIVGGMVIYSIVKRTLFSAK